ncbi:hypothetical protein RhiirA5_385197, partial [Rhizophagus irregularis]
MPFLCSCRICKINSKDGNGKWLSTRKTFKKHQKREKANIEKINESEAESGSETKSDSESISSCNAAEKRKFEDDESDKSDTSSESNISNNDHVPVILKDIPKRSEDYDDDDSDEPFLDNEDYNNGNPIPNNEDYDKNSDRQSLDNKDCDEEDDKGDIETESDCSQTSAYISEENDELTDDDKEFEESEMTNINDDELIQGLRLLHTKVLHSISDIAFNKILDNVNSNLTIYKLKKKINSIVPFEPHRYDTCKNSCIAFTSSYENLASCPICGENRFDDNGKPVNTTFFFSVKERLIIQYKNKERAEELQYRKGVQCIDGRTNEPFILRAHLLTWTGDVPALSKSLNLSGHNSYKGCRFCMIKGTCHPSNKHIYYPSSAFCNIRNHDDTINMGKLIEEETNKDRKDEMIRETGIKGSSELLKLQTLLFPWSFPTDIMHLFFENVAPSMYAHWSGKFFYNNLLLSSDYELSKSQWESIGIQMEKVKKDMPIEIGRPPRDIFKYHNGYKAVEWRNWIILFSLPLLKVYLDKRHLQGWANFVKSVKLCLEPEISEEQIDDVQILLKKFSDYYEREYYQNNGQRLAACKISFHYLLHVADSIKYCGPSWTHWQFPMEREVNNYGVRYGRLRTSDGQYISSCCIKRNNKIARNNYCAQ